MVLDSSSPTLLHVLQNAVLVLFAATFAPLCIFIAVASQIVAPFTKTAKHIKQHRKWRAISSSTFRPRTVLVTGVGMSKGLALARIFYRDGHRVIGADFEPYRIPVSGRFSVALDKFYTLSKPHDGGSAAYTKQLKDIIEKERVELWVSCSGVASAVTDGEAADRVEAETDCKVIQFTAALTETLHEKHSFIEHTRKLGLNVPETHAVTSGADALAALYFDNSKYTKKQFIMKSIGLDDSVRADMTILPRPSSHETEEHIKRVNPTPSRPFVLQQYIKGPEFCTHSLIIKGAVRAFVACPSSDLQMHYAALASSSLLSRAMLLYTKLYFRNSPEATGHFSLDFLVSPEIAEKGMRSGVSDSEVEGLMDKIYPIECNPRAHTAVVLFANEAEDLADAYLSVLEEHEPKGVANGHTIDNIVVPRPNVASYYWIGHDLVTLVALPLLAFLQLQLGLKELLQKWLEFVEHVVFWREGSFETWDPWPMLFLYVVYWPLIFLACLWEGKWWSRCNVSTTKVFVC